MNNIPLFNLKKSNSKLEKEILADITLVYKNNSFTYGKHTDKFEKAFAKLCQTKYAIGVHSGTDSLILALKALGLGLKDEVITTPCTFSASSDCIIHVGAKPVFVDVETKTGNIDPLLIEQAITKNTKAILLVHLYGIPCKMDEIKKIAKKYNLKIIEDASHAHGSLYKNKPVGSLGDVGCFSLYPSKSLGAIGNAGIITTNSAQLAKKIRMLANHGIKNQQTKYVHHTNGYNKLIDNIQSVALLHKIPDLKRVIQVKLSIAKKYNNELFLKGLQQMYWDKNTLPSIYVFAFQTRNRKKIKEYFEKNGVSTGIYYPIPLHLQPSMKFLGYKKGMLPNAEKFFKQTLSIPCYPELTENEIEHIVQTMKGI